MEMEANSGDKVGQSAAKPQDNGEGFYEGLS